MTRKRNAEEKMGRRLVAVVAPPLGRRFDAYCRAMRARAGGEFTESSAIRSLLVRALDSLGVKDPAVQVSQGSEAAGGGAAGR